jgi:hypothetical protein
MTNSKQFLIYTAPSGAVRVDVLVQGESVWLTQDQLAQLFGRERSVISKHLKNIFRESELVESSNVQILHIAGSDKPVRFYSLDVIISVGYRVNSFQATQFRIWATTTLREFIAKGFVLDDERLKKRSRIFMRCQWTTPLNRQRRLASLPRFKTSCTGRSQGKQRLS